MRIAFLQLGVILILMAGIAVVVLTAYFSIKPSQTVQRAGQPLPRMRERRAHRIEERRQRRAG